MKIISPLMMALYVVLVLPVAKANYIEDLSCSISDYGLGVIPHLFQTNCKIENGDEAEYCKCLKTSNNILINAANENQAEKLAKDQETLKQSYNKKLEKVLFQINTGVHLQQQTYGIDKKGKQTDCTKERFAKEFEDSICRSLSKDGSTCVDKEIRGAEFLVNSNNLDTCGLTETCKELYSEINLAWEQSQGKKKASSSSSQRSVGGLDHLIETATKNLCNAGKCSVAIDPSNASVSRGKGSSEKTSTETSTNVEPATDMWSWVGIKKSISPECALTDEKRNQINEMLEFFTKHDGIANSSLVNNLKKIRDEKSICNGNDVLFNHSLTEFKFKSSYSPLGSKAARDIPTEGRRLVEDALEAQKIKGDEVLKNGFQKAANENSCVSYDKYKVLSSVPESGLIKQWSTLSDAQIADSLDPKVLTTSSSPALQFIRNNPMLAKMVISKKARSDLAKGLKAFAGKSQGKDKSGQVADFIEFMKKDASGINNGMEDLLQCELLARNAAAVHSSNLFPQDTKVVDSGGFGLQDNLYACAMMDLKKNNKLPVTKLDEILDSNALFELLGSPVEISVNDPKEDKNYQKFLADNCNGFEDFRKNYIDNYCKMINTGPKCKEKFNDFSKSRVKNLLKKYYEKHNTNLGSLTSIVTNNTKNVDFDDLDESSSDANQDHQLIQEYEEKIKPNTFSSIYENGQGFSDKMVSVHDKIAKAQADYDKRISSSSTGRGSNPNDFTSNESNLKGDKSSDFDQITNIKKTTNVLENITNPGQVVPNYLSNNSTQNAAPQINSKNISSLKEATDIVDKLSSKEGSSLKPEKKEEIVKDVQKYFDGAKDNNAEMAKLQDKISDLEDQISGERKDKKNDRAPASFSSSSAPVLPPMMPPLNQNFAGAVPYAPGFSPTGTAGGKIQRMQSASAASYQKALNDKYIQSEKDATPFNSSTDQFVLNKEPYVGASGGEVLVGLELSPSKEEFSKIVTSEDNLKKYLNENLTKLPGSKIISIKCGLQCGPSSNDLILHVERDQFNKIVIRSVASSTPVARVHKLDTLSNEFKAIK